MKLALGRAFDQHGAEMVVIDPSRNSGGRPRANGHRPRGRRPSCSIVGVVPISVQ
jgi:hypothetical protein